MCMNQICCTNLSSGVMAVTDRGCLIEVHSVFILHHELSIWWYMFLSSHVQHRGSRGKVSALTVGDLGVKLCSSWSMVKPCHRHRASLLACPPVAWHCGIAVGLMWVY